jgi:hypothetical protein
MSIQSIKSPFELASQEMLPPLTPIWTKELLNILITSMNSQSDNIYTNKQSIVNWKVIRSEVNAALDPEFTPFSIKDCLEIFQAHTFTWTAQADAALFKAIQNSFEHEKSLHNGKCIRWLHVVEKIAEQFPEKYFTTDCTSRFCYLIKTPSAVSKMVSYDSSISVSQFYETTLKIYEEKVKFQPEQPTRNDSSWTKTRKICLMREMLEIKENSISNKITGCFWLNVSKKINEIPNTSKKAVNVDSCKYKFQDLLLELTTK